MVRDPLSDDAIPSLSDVERRHIQRVLDDAGWNKKRAARILGINRGTLYRKISEYELVDRKPRPPLAARGESRSYEGSTQSIRRTTLTRMAMGTRETDQPPLWIADLPIAGPSVLRATTLLDGHHFDRFVEGLCERARDRPSSPGRYFRLLLVGYSVRNAGWRRTPVRSAVGRGRGAARSFAIARTRRLIDLETHRTVFTWVQQRTGRTGRD